VSDTNAETQPSLFDLAPGGACHASRVAARAVRSYRTLSPLPRRRGGLLSVALSLKRPKPPRRALPGTVPSWSPDFPRTLFPEEKTTRDRPAFRRAGFSGADGERQWRRRGTQSLTGHHWRWGSQNTEEGLTGFRTLATVATPPRESPGVAKCGRNL